MSRRRKNKTRENCAFCGKPASTNDHVPPKGLYREPRPNNLITVPACQKCNKGSDKDDEFIQYFAMTYGAERSVDAIGVSQKVLRAIQRPQKRGMRAALFQSLQPVQLVSPLGLYAGQTFSMKLEGERLERILQKIIKGMYWHIRKERVPNGYRVYSHLIGRQPGQYFQQTEQQILAFPEYVIGDQAFAYRYVMFDEIPGLSVWRFEFYRTIGFMGYTIKPGETETVLLSIEDAPQDSTTSH